MKQVVCRLCLKILEVGASEFELLGNVSHMLDLVSLKLNLHIVKEPLVCKDCKEKLQKCFNFKLTCKHTGESLVSNMNTPENDQKLKMKECRFCSKLTKCNTNSQLQSYEKFFATHMPEMRLKATNDVSICDSCHISLGNYADFIKTCSEQETKIENYRKSAGLHDENVESSIDLLRVLEYSVENCITTIKEEISVEEKPIFENTTTTTEVKQETSEEEKLLFGNATTAIDVCLNSDNILVDEEFSNATGNSNVQETVENNLIPVASETTEVSDGDSNCDSQSVIVLDDDTDEEPDNNVNGAKENNSLPQTTRQPVANAGTTYLMMLLAPTPMQQCTESDLQCETYKADPEEEKFTNEDHKINLEDIPEDFYISEEIDKCEILNTQTDTYNCNICGGTQIKSKSTPRFHLCHDADSLERVYRCDICNYKSGKKNRVTKHMKVHMDPSDMLKCPDCEYKTKHESCLISHKERHMDRSQLTLYKCHVCNLETRHKSSLVKHVTIHRSDRFKYKCEICGLILPRQDYLKRHMDVHKNPSEFETFKCDYCMYRTNRKKTLNVHLLTHNALETTVYKCEHCDFTTKRDVYLKQHMQIRHDLPGAKIYLCEICGFKSKRKSYLKHVHMRKHDAPSNIRNFKCNNCDYQAKLKPHLITHMITHKDPSEVERFECEICQFCTKYKHIIRNHMKRHNKR